MTADLRLTAGFADLARVREFVAGAAQALGASRATIDALVQAADELATNSIEHGYRGRSGPLHIQVSAEGDRIVVVLRDQGAAFDPTTVAAPNLNVPLEERPIGGMGIFLARQLTDELSWRRLRRGNEIRLARHK